MRRLVQRITGAAAAAGLAGAGLVAAAVPAQAAACSGTSGVTVVVDFGGSTQVRCAPGDPSSGLDALGKAGFAITYVQTQPGFVCRIDGFPGSDPCRNTPPSSAYWSYWHAERGGSWTYSSVGAGSRNPKPGTVEGWSFGSGGQPGTAPPAPTATSTPKTTTSTPKTTPKTTSKPRTTTAPKATTAAPRTTSPGSTPRTSPTAAAGSPGTTPSGSPSADPSGSATPTPDPSATGLPSGTPDPSDGPTTSALQPVTRDDSGGGVGTLVAGGGLVALVGAGAAWAAWRRRAA
ncbi:hypothetical protein [uncultured Phycicoccus sp.]|uniref:hypothetical protein n=1 Tax=uncultured Phycicoccus sp. TaxID=661422 RepID=UPI00262FA63F|nr:hypothetical protein [uncultured Phycicoccus sp.]